MRELMRDRVAWAIGMLAVAAVLCSGPGWASSRVALVVGNGAYTAGNIPALANPVNDAKLMAEALETSGFEVQLVTDANQAAMRASIEAFGERLEQAGGESVGLFYYAGHGVEVKGYNYLIPIGAEIEREVEFMTDAVPADWVMSWMGEVGNRLNIVILDACRNNPYEGRNRGASQGLAQMNAPTGTLIAYSAAPKQVAVDGEGDNSPYTAALAKAMVEPGLKVEDVFKRVRVAVEEATNGEQTPWESSSLRGDFYFVAQVEEPPAPEPPTVAVTVTETVSPELTVRQLAARAYEAAERIHTESSYRLVIERFPGTSFAGLAEQQIKVIESATVTPVRSPEEDEASLHLERKARERIQIGLWSLGFNPGSPDGRFGERTRKAIREWQAARGESATGFLDSKSAAMLLKAGESAPPPEPKKTVAKEATNFLTEALSIARSLGSPWPRNDALGDLAVAQAKVGEVSEALRTVQDITSVHERITALGAIAKGRAKASDASEALRTAIVEERSYLASKVYSDDLTVSGANCPPSYP